MRVRAVNRGPLFPNDGPAGPRIARRVKGIAIETGAFAALTLAWWFLFGEPRGIVPCSC